MAEENNTQTNKQPEQETQNVENNNQSKGRSAEDISGDASKYVRRVEANKREEFRNVSKKEIISVVTNSLSELQKRRYIEEKGLDGEKLTPEQEAEAKKYRISKDDKEVQEILEKARKDLVGRVNNREKELNELYGRKGENSNGKINKLREEAQNQQAENEKAIRDKRKEKEQLEKNPDKSKEDVAKIEALNNEIAYLEQQNSLLKQTIEDIDGNEKKVGLLKRADDCAKQNQRVKREGIQDLGQAFEQYVDGGKDLVYNDQGLKEGLRMAYNPETKDFEKYQPHIQETPNDNVMSNEEVTPQTQEKSGKGKVIAGVAGAGVGAAAGAVAATNSGKNQPEKDNIETIENQPIEDNKSVGEELEKEDDFYAQKYGFGSEEAKEAMAFIGYDPEKKVNFGNSVTLLKSFLKFPDRQMAILKDEKASKVIYEAMQKAGGSKNPINVMRFAKTKKGLQDIAEVNLPQNALYDFVKENPNYNFIYNKGNEFTEFREKYLDLHKRLESKKITEEQFKEEKEKLKGEFGPSIMAACEYRENASKSIGNISFIDKIMTRNQTHQKYLEAPKEFDPNAYGKENEIAKEKIKKGIEQREVLGYGPIYLRGSTKAHEEYLKDHTMQEAINTNFGENDIESSSKTKDDFVEEMGGVYTPEEKAEKVISRNEKGERIVNDKTFDERLAQKRKEIDYRGLKPNEIETEEKTRDLLNSREQRKNSKEDGPEI